MNTDVENVKQAKESFNRVLDNKIYAGIIKDDSHLSLLLDLVNGGKYNKILDIGTGTGYLAFPLAEQFPTAGVCGIDIADAIVEKNNAAVKEKGIPNLSFQAFDGIKYPFPDESVDLIVTRYAFHHFPDAVNAIQQMNRILVKGGKVLVSDPMRNEKDDNGFTREKQVITDMKFPFAKRPEYIELYDRIAEKEKSLYDITNDNGVIWVGHCNVGNTVFVKQ